MPDEVANRPGAASPLDALGAAIAARGEGNTEEIIRFARRLYANLAEEDLRAAPPADLAAAAVSLLALARRRLPGVAKVRVFNPRRDEVGWDARHTVVQMVNDDMPFLVDSVTAEFARREMQVHVIAHPVMPIRRDEQGEARTTGTDETAPRESLMHIEIDRVGDTAVLDDLAAALARVLAEVRQAVEDWRRMRAACLTAVAELQSAGSQLPAGEISEAQAFLRWIETHRFTFLGYRRYRYTAAGGYDLVAGSGLGILRQPDERLFADGAGSGVAMSGIVASPHPITLLKTDRQSLVHRPGPMDCIIVKSFDGDGRAVGEHRFAGLFTSAAYHTPPSEIPLLRQKVAAVMRRAAFDPHSHDGKALAAILDSWPRDELFQVDEDTLYDAGLGVLQLQERHRTALFVRRDRLGRFVSCLVFAPRERYDSALRRRFARILERAYHGHVTSYSATVGDESTLARVLFIVRLSDPQAPLPDSEAIEQRLADAATTWSDRLKLALAAMHGDAEGHALLRRWGESFPLAYREHFDATEAVDDLRHIQQVIAGQALGIKLERRAGQESFGLCLKLFHMQTPIALSDILPPLENMGLRVLTEAPYRLGIEGGTPMWLHDFVLETADRSNVDINAVEEPFETALERTFTGAMESDGLNRLALVRGVGWRDITLLRCYGRFLRQAGLPFSSDYIDRALVTHADIARHLIDLFHARLDPGLGAHDDPRRAARVAEIDADIDPALDAVSSLDEDRILRRLRNAITCTLRTNFFQHRGSGEPKPYLSVKLDSRKLDELPLPRPMVEVFVYSPRVEGVHMRGGKVARGGIRWSDRREDFRSEILGLMKAQMVKNAVIVPVGSKGGFYVKRPPLGGSREQVQAEGIECYRLLVRGLLDITDNIGPQGIVHPAGVVRHDEDDPYLVVAADKGTATFSDIANALSGEYGFWLGDAFASGGSQGYDHKEMGITARGAWECVKRHFRDLGTDVQASPFTAVGVGDMSGDVFGNGMLQSRATRLIAAFDHRHIFIDPDPDPERSWVERKRLFDLPRSSWMDYDKALLSPGGGVYERSAKSITLSEHARQALGIDAQQVPPVALMRAILLAPVDLLWFGGIGTYLKAHGETAAEVGDRANEPLRIEGREVRARVIGEGANLGCTQKGRIEAAQAGVHLNTDALDNSAGVDTSDHEVNIKIALGEAIARNALSLEERDRLLTAMTDEVAALVLRDNYQQSQSIGVAAAQAKAQHAQHAHMMRSLANAGQLDVTVEFLPDGNTMRKRGAAGQPLTRPELCVLLAYGKIVANDEILASELPDDPLLEQEVLRYFPSAMREGFAQSIRSHRLRREIIALQVTNSMVNRVGSTFLQDLRARTGHETPDIARAFTVTRDAWRLRDIWGAIEALDGKLIAGAQTEMLIATQRFIERVSVWLLQNVAQPMNMLAATERFRPVVTALEQDLESLAAAAIATRAEAFAKLGAPQDIAQRVAALDRLAAAGDVALLAEASDRPVGTVARLYFALGERLGLDWLTDAGAGLPREGAWAGQAANALTDELLAAQRNLSAAALEAPDASADAEATLEAWAARRRQPLERFDALLAELRGSGTPDLAMLAVAARQLRTLERV